MYNYTSKHYGEDFEAEILADFDRLSTAETFCYSALFLLGIAALVALMMIVWWTLAIAF